MHLLAIFTLHKDHSGGEHESKANGTIYHHCNIFALQVISFDVFSPLEIHKHLELLPQALYLNTISPLIMEEIRLLLSMILADHSASKRYLKYLLMSVQGSHLHEKSR